MSLKDQNRSSKYNQNPGGENENRQPGKTKTIIYLIISAFIFGALIASGVTFALLKGGYLALNDPTQPPIPTPTPSPTSSLIPTPTPSPTPSLDISNNCQTFSPLGFLSEARFELRTRN